MRCITATLKPHLNLPIDSPEGRIGSAVGGLPELVDASFAPGSIEGLNRELEHVLALAEASPVAPDAPALVSAHAPAYLLDAQPNWAGRAVGAQVA